MSIVGLILVAQATAVSAAPGAASLPDIEIRARATIRSLEIRAASHPRLVLRAEPGDAPPVTIARSAPAGRKKYRNLSIDLHGIARLAAPQPIAAIDSRTGD